MNRMTMTLQEQAWQSGLVLLEETTQWNQNDWPPLVGAWRNAHATVVLNHLDADNNDIHKTRQTVVLLGGYQQGQGVNNSVLVLNLADSDKQWREGPPMNQSRRGHAAVVCNGGVYVMGGSIGFSSLDCIERIDVNDLLPSSLTTTTTTQEGHWTTLKYRLSMKRSGCCAVAVHNRYIVVMGGYYGGYLSLVDIIDTNNHTVTSGPSMNVPRSFCSSAVIGHRIFVVGGRNEHGYFDSVEYIDFARPCDNEGTKKETGSFVIFFSSVWTTHSDLVLSNARDSCAVVAVGSCLVVAGGWDTSTVEVLDTHRNRVWNLPPFGNERDGCTLATVANQIAVIGGYRNTSCATLPLMDKNTWCFRRLCEQQPNRWNHFQEGMSIGDVIATTHTYRV